MADTISLPSVLPSEKKKMVRSRRKSIDDYQRLIVDRIKCHFDRRRKQWDLDLKRKSDCLSRASSMTYLPEKVSSDVTTSYPMIGKACERLLLANGAIDAKANNKEDCSFEPHGMRNKPVRCASVKIVSSNVVTTQPSCSYNRIQLEVDISEFLPDGEVRFSATKDGLEVCAKCVRRGEGSVEKVKVVPIKGLIESERLKFRPSSTGTMILELCVSKV